MSKGKEFTGKSVEAAIGEAEAALGAPRDELDIQVLSQGSRGVFGLGGEPARVLAHNPNEIELEEPSARESPVKPEPSLPTAVAEPGDLDEQEQVAPAPRRRSHVEALAVADDDFETKPTAPPDQVAAAAQAILENLLTKMGFEVEVSIRPNEDPVTLDVRGDNLGILIGRRGDSLASLQFMVNVILSKEFKSWPRVVIDVQGYRARREQSLSSLGQRVADRVRRNRRPFTLEAMPANDRRIIHLTLRERTDVETYSIGEGQSRRVVIAPKH